MLYNRISEFKNLKPSVTMDLFDKYVSPILNYSCEVWGFHNAPDVERLHLSFCKRLLRVKKTTQNDFVYGELGRYPMYIFRYIRIIKYWLKIVTGKKVSIYMYVISDIRIKYR